MYRFTEALTVWDHPFWREWALDDLDRYCEVVAASPARLGIEADFVLGGRTGSPTCSTGPSTS